MFEFFIRLTQITVPIFVISTMLNVGLTQKPSAILEHLSAKSFVWKMLLANFVLVPLLTILLLRPMPFDPALKAGLLIFGLCAGAPFLIKLTQAAQHDMALGAATMMLLMVITAIYVPVVLPLVLTGVSVDAWAIARSLLLQMLLPIGIGMAIAETLPDVTKAIQPWVGRLGNITLYVLIASTLIGYFPNMIEIVGTGAIVVGLVIVLAAFAIGYFLNKGRDHHEDIGGLGTAQRNTAAGFLIATQNFADPNVLVILTIANTLGIVMLLFIARFLSRDNPAVSPAD
jgi:bile acid:Na+ symporter, BASS family